MLHAGAGHSALQDFPAVRHKFPQPLMLFVVGMLSVFVGVVFSGREVYRSYKIILIEVTAEE